MAAKNKSTSFDDKLNELDSQIQALLRLIDPKDSPKKNQQRQKQIADLTKKRQDLFNTRGKESEQDGEFVETVESRIIGGDFANLQNTMRDQALAEMAGGSVEDKKVPTKDKRQNISTEIGDASESAYRITSGEEPVTSGDFANLQNTMRDQALAEMAEPEMAETPAESKPRRKSPPRAEYEPAPEEEPEAAPPKAIPVAPEDDEMLSTLFKTATGTPFDPKSSRDADYMKKIRETLAEQGGLKGMTPTQFALKLYRKYD